jgi:hypothetical protein
MRIQNLIPVFMFCLISALSQANTSTSQKEFAKRYIEGMVTNNSALFVDQFSESIKIMPEYDKSYLGLENATSYFASIFERYEVRALERSTVDVINIGERSIEIGNFDMRFSQKGDDQIVVVPGTYFEVWDTSSKKNPKLLTMAWNYNEHADGIENRYRAHAEGGIHYAFLPTAPIDSPISFEVASQHDFVTTLMLRKQPETLAVRFAKDGWYAAHNMPIQKSKKAMTEHLIEYAKNWPAFDFVDVNAHEIYAHEDYTLEHISYNLRWRTKEHTGIAIGKGIRIAKINSQGVLQVYRSIAMHD